LIYPANARNDVRGLRIALAQQEVLPPTRQMLISLRGYGQMLLLAQVEQNGRIAHGLIHHMLGLARQECHHRGATFAAQPIRKRSALVLLNPTHECETYLTCIDIRPGQDALQRL